MPVMVSHMCWRPHVHVGPGRFSKSGSVSTRWYQSLFFRQALAPLHVALTGIGILRVGTCLIVWALGLVWHHMDRWHDFFWLWCWWTEQAEVGTAKYALAFMCDNGLRLWHAFSVLNVDYSEWDYGHPQQPGEAGSDVKSSSSSMLPCTGKTSRF